MTLPAVIAHRDVAAEIRSRPCPACLICGASGDPLYAGLSDRFFNASGEWSLKRCSNSKCGLLWLDPMPLEEDIGKAYADYFTHTSPDSRLARPTSWRTRAAVLFRSAYLGWRFNYGEGVGKPLRWLLALPILITRIECDGLDIPVRYLAVSSKGRMLDVGCGDGWVLKLARELGWDAEGVDFDPQAVANARRAGLNVCLGRLIDQHLPGDSFDLVWMSHVIEHLHDPLGALREIRRLLRPNGLLVITTPNADSGGHRRFGANWAALDPPRHLRIFSAANLVDLVRSSGFSRSRVSSTLRITPFDFAESRLIRRCGRGDMMYPAAMREALYGRLGSVAQLIRRRWNPLIADELLLTARI